MMSLARPQAVLFDLDGTLVDSAPDLTTAINRMLDELGRTRLEQGQVRDWIGNGARQLVARALLGQRAVNVEPQETDAALTRFLVHYQTSLVEQSLLYPGVREGLETIYALHLPMAIVTNKPGAFTQPLIEALGLAAFFPICVSGDTLAVKKPDPAPLIHAAKQLGVDIRQSIYVGDSRADVDAANAAGATMVRVPYGYSGGDELVAAHPSTLTFTVMELATELAG